MMQLSSARTLQSADCSTRVPLTLFPQGPLIGFIAIVTSTILPLISQHIYNTAQLPGGNGSALRGNITIAGLLWAVRHGAVAA